ncbi:MAG: ABC transporter substrate-binding protein [Dichotomicrobium sp.]
MHMLRGAVLAILCLVLIAPARAAEPIRIGLLKFGTVNWEIDVVQHHELDEKHGIALDVTALASTQATRVALQAGSVDMIVSDWLWVSRQRGKGSDFTMIPYSSALGAVMVAADSGTASLADLKGKSVGIAGGPLDKSWLMLRAYSRKTLGFDLEDAVEPAFGAPPLLAEKFAQGELDAVLNYWHYAARLEARGFKRLIGMNDVVKGLGGSGSLAMIGYTFTEDWAENNRSALRGFRRAVAEARRIMATSDEEWQRLAPLVQARDARTLELLRDHHRQGIPEETGEIARDAALIFDIIAELGGDSLTGGQKALAPGTFWEGGDG